MEVKQIRHLLYKLGDVYKMFVNHVQNGEDTIKAPIKLSKFCALRPPDVKLVADTPVESCLCFYHSNFISCCSAMNRYVKEFPTYSPQLISIILCDHKNTSCWKRLCSECSVSQIKKICDEMLKR
ncbi:hypothetical protein Bhyg_03054 [Pseudolycoriella hygida]|uniref:Uncharacterized protein n=1 Tax=Pseudolycoriella hygida TaxID=35572 RepID=A0A9Q0NCK9_9DIPT|nr:hypothetical protein Bhyg_03054 [Pseudolycoriella hygida]